MKSILAISAAVALVAFLPACQATKSAAASIGAGIKSLANNPQVTADAAIALNVAQQYEAIAKQRTVTAVDWEQIALSAVNQFIAAQGAPVSPASTATSIQLAEQAVSLYDAGKAKPAAAAKSAG